MSNFLDSEVDKVLSPSARTYERRGPKPRPETMKATTIQFTEEQQCRLDAYSAQQKLSKGEIVRRAVEEFLSREEAGS